MKGFSILILVGLGIIFSAEVFAQNYSQTKNELNPSDTDLIILFSVAIAIILGIVIFLTRELILRKKTNYETDEFESKKNKDYEKYHSDWGGESVLGEKKSKFDDEFRKELEESDVPDYYKILGVSSKATHEEIKNRFRILAKETHPDKSKDSKSEKKMAEINRAYEILSDELHREQYDKHMGVSKS